jgi:predicted RNase H-like HicB family nuclease
VPNCYSQGHTIEAALDNIREAIELCLEDMQIQGHGGESVLSPVGRRRH